MKEKAKEELFKLIKLNFEIGSVIETMAETEGLTVLDVVKEYHEQNKTAKRKVFFMNQNK